jgi:hypothetical protein
MAGIIGTEVWVLETSDRHGQDVSVYASHEGAYAALADIASEGWNEVPASADMPESPDGLSEQEMVEIYYRNRADEDYFLSAATIQP